MSGSKPDFAARPAPRMLNAPLGGRVLCFAPHPDDEVIGPGGALAMHVGQLDPVRVVIATDGGSGDPDRMFPAGGFVKRRRHESKLGLAELGVRDLEFWGYPDACELTDADVEGIAARVRAELDGFRPDVVYLPWDGEHNADHRALCAGVLRAMRVVEWQGTALGYEVWSPLEPDVVLDIEAVVEKKRRAIACYASQLRYIDYVHVILGLNAYRSLHCGRGRGHAEAFRELRTP